MTVGDAIWIGALVLMVVLILRGIRRHPRGGDGSGNQYGAGPDQSGTGTGLGGSGSDGGGGD